MIVFLNMLVASRNNDVKRFVYAASSSTYGDSKGLSKMEDVIGKSLSPLSEFDVSISNIEVSHSPNHLGDIPHSHASVNKAINV